MRRRIAMASYLGHGHGPACFPSFFTFSVSFHISVFEMSSIVKRSWCRAGARASSTEITLCFSQAFRTSGGRIILYFTLASGTMPWWKNHQLGHAYGRWSARLSSQRKQQQDWVRGNSRLKMQVTRTLSLKRLPTVSPTSMSSIFKAMKTKPMMAIHLVKKGEQLLEEQNQLIQQTAMDGTRRGSPKGNLWWSQKQTKINRGKQGSRSWSVEEQTAAGSGMKWGSDKASRSRKGEGSREHHHRNVPSESGDMCRTFHSSIAPMAEISACVLPVGSRSMCGASALKLMTKDLSQDILEVTLPRTASPIRTFACRKVLVV